MSKIRISVGTLGHIDHGKTTFTAALLKYSHKLFLHVKADAFNEIDFLKEERVRGITIISKQKEMETQNYVVTLIDSPGHRDYIKNMITGTAQMDYAILVLSVLDGVMPQTREHLMLAKQIGISKIIVVLNKMDADEIGVAEIAEADCREYLAKYGYPEDTPFIKCSALKYLEGDDSYESGMAEVMEKIDNYFDIPKRDVDKPFLMAVDSVITKTGRGTVTTGKVLQGVLKVGEVVEQVGFIDNVKTYTVTGIETFRRAVSSCQAGDSVGILLRGAERNALDSPQRGTVLAKPSTIKASDTFIAELYVSTKEEGGRATPFFVGYKPQFYFRTGDVTGVVGYFSHTKSENFDLNQAVSECKESLKMGKRKESEMVMPGDNIFVGVKLVSPIAISEGVRFSIREGGSTVGAGVITKVLE